MQIIRYSNEYEKIWDDFVLNSKNGTIFHTRKFLSYHKDRFEDNSVLIYKKNRLIGIFPATKIDNTIYSHRGSTYGGLVVGVRNRLKDSLEMFEGLINFYNMSIEFRKSEYIFDKYPSEEVEFAAKYLGFKEKCQELSTCLDLNFLKLTKGRKSSINKCKNLKIVFDDFNYQGYYAILKSNLKRHNSTPTHSLEEMKLLKKILPNNYFLVSIYYENRLMAGIWLVLATPFSAHTFYIAQDYEYSNFQPLTCLILHIINYLKSKNYRYLNFGISTERCGEYLNLGLFEFKESFGGFGVIRKTFRIDI